MVTALAEEGFAQARAEGRLPFDPVDDAVLRRTPASA